jgi:ABC-2 type transport system ATP-binding protein
MTDATDTLATTTTTAGSTGLAVEARDVHLRYGRTEALRGLSFQLEAGTICGLLGRNGSGKTSLMSLLASLRRPNAGEVLVAGSNPFENASLTTQIGLIGESSAKSTIYKVKDAVAVVAVMRPSWDPAFAKRLLDRFEISQKTKISSLSRGKRAALGAVFGLAARTPLTMFDEPHLGMDVPSRYAFYEELLADYLEHPRTIILSTHHFEEVASLFSEIVVLDEGQLVVHDDVETLRARGSEVTGAAETVDRFTAELTVLNSRQLGGTKAAVVYGELADDRRRAARDAGLEIGPIPLQDLFVHLTAARRAAPAMAQEPS